MKVNVIVKMDGTVTLAVAQGGEFDAAKQEILAAVEGLRAEGVDFAEVGEVERHRHDDPNATHAHTHEHAH